MLVDLVKMPEHRIQVQGNGEDMEVITIAESEEDQEKDEMREGQEDNQEEAQTDHATFVSTLKSYCEKYFDNTTVHGFSYVLTGENRLERIAWVFLVIFAFMGAFTLIAIYIDEAVADPIAIQLSTIPVKEIPFPAVTIDSGQQWNVMGFPRKALYTEQPDEDSPGRDMKRKCFFLWLANTVQNVLSCQRSTCRSYQGGLLILVGSY